MASAATTVALEGFETDLQGQPFVYFPTNSPWKFSGTGSGIQRNGSRFGAPSAPEGVQTAFLTGNNAHALSSHIRVPAGEYTIEFSAARSAWLGDQPNPVKVYINGWTDGKTIAPTDTSFRTYKTSAFPLSTDGWYNVEFVSTVVGDRVTFIDNVKFVPVATGGSKAAAKLFYTDLDSGPNTGGANNKGVFLTLHGKNFGAARGTSTVTMGGVAVDTYVSWSDTKIVVQPGPKARTGSVAVNTAQGASNGVPFTVRPGPIYFVSASGNGDGSIASPMNPSGLYAATKPGATFYFRGGSYTGQYGNQGYGDYNLEFGSAKGGTAGNPVAVVGYPGETATFSGHKGVLGFRDADMPAPPAHHITAANLRMVCNETCVHSAADSGRGITKSGAANIRLVNNVMSATYTHDPQTGLISIGNDGWRVFGNELKDTGSVNPVTEKPFNTNHAIYVQVGASNIDIGWNYLHDMRMGHLIQVHTDEPSVHTNVLIHDNVLTAAKPGDARGINVGETLAGSNGAIYNNVLSNLGADFSAIAIYSGNWKIFNNTLHNIDASPGMVWLSNEIAKPTAVIANNLFYSNGRSPYFTFGHGATASQVQMSNNLYFNGTGGLPSMDTAPVTGNPLFVNAAGLNFRLQGSSPAVNKGSAVAGPVVKTDLDGIARPQQGAFDIGAFEHAP